MPSSFRPYGRSYGPWTDARVPTELREPYSLWSFGPDNTYGGRPIKRPSTIIALGLLMGAIALFPLILVATVRGPSGDPADPAVWVVAGLASVLLLPPSLFFLYVGLVRRAWVRRVKRATGMSPFTMNRRNLPPPGCEVR